MQIPLIQVDAFASQIFTGNPAAVCPLVEWPSDSVLGAIAAENNLAETAFVAPVPGRYRLRWFTPTHEVDLCGHATLAAAHVVFTRLREDLETIEFESRSGVLTVTRDAHQLTMDLPWVRAEPADGRPDLVAALGGPSPRETHRIRSIHGAEYFMFVYSSMAEVAALTPSFSDLSANIIATADEGAASMGADFVSRFFSPASQGGEDPVTGSAHCTLAPYWAEKLGKKSLVGRQISKRGGTVQCLHAGGRVFLGGNCVDYLEGTIQIP